jgi:putative SOS response-associated peptidase YedK
MCGRVGFFSQEQFIKEAAAILKKIQFDEGMFHTSYNIAPSQGLGAILNSGDVVNSHFGLIPNWAKDRKFQPINARAESITQKPTFRKPFQSQRCLIPINGFYEWQKSGSTKTPYWIYPTDNDYFALAGIYDTWSDKSSGEIITSSAIITTEPNELMAPIHNRMPVILKKEDWNLWLDPEVKESEVLTPLLQPYANELMDAYAVSSFVNSPANNTRGCIEPAIKTTLF